MFVWNSDIREINRMERCLSKNSHYYIEELHLEILHRARIVVRTSTQTFSLFDPESSAQRLRQVLYACLTQITCVSYIYLFSSSSSFLWKSTPSLMIVAAFNLIGMFPPLQRKEHCQLHIHVIVCTVHVHEVLLH